MPNPGARGTLVVALLTASTAWAATSPGARPARAPAAGRVSLADPTAPVATVGALSVSRSELDQRAGQALAEYRARGGGEVPRELQPVVRRQILERLIQRDLLGLEAQRQGVTASDEEGEALLRKDPFFIEGGIFNEAKYLAVKNGNPAQFRNALEQAKLSATATKLTARAAARQHIDEREIRSRAMRGLERATFEYLALRRAEFNGAFPEPREAEILDSFGTHAAGMHRPDRAVLSVLWVQQELSDSVLARPGGLGAWERGLESRADSLLKLAQQGGRLEDLAKDFGGLKTQVVVLPGNFPGYWRGDARLSASAFDQKPGTLLPRLVPSNPGWLIVRVDEVERAHPARLSEVAREIRETLRLDRRQHTEERELRAIYQARLDSLKGTGYRVRYAVIDTAALDPGPPSADDLDRFYRGHLADYSTYNSSTGSIVSQPFTEVREEVAARWRVERRLELARALAEHIEEVWSQGKRDEKAEHGARVRDAGPVPLGAPVDSGSAAAAVTDSVRARTGALGVGVGRYSGGMIVFHVFARVPGYVPSFEQARPTLEAWRQDEQGGRDERGGRELYDRDPKQFAIGNTLHWSSLVVEPPDFMSMKMTHREVEEYLHRHIDKYSAPELVHASHILISPADGSAEADARARARADSLLQRLRNGEDFARLARSSSDDPATGDQGGDLGSFGHGTMLQEIERVAFALKPGEMSGVVRTEVGYHIIRCHEHLAPVVQPLALMYSNVSSDLAIAKSDSAAARRADSLHRVLRTPAQARAAGAKLHLGIIPYQRAIGQPAGNDEKRGAYFRGLEQLKPGQLYPGVFYQKDMGYMLSWVDSVTAPRAPTWEEARQAAIDRFRRSAAQRAMDAKRAELDSLTAAGWSLDSLSALWGGLEQAVDANRSTVLPALGRRDLDTLVFGSRVPARLKIGEVSDWVRFPLGLVRMRVLERFEPNASQLGARMESERRLAEARVLSGYYEELKKRFPVRILDPDLRAVELPPIPEETPP